MSVTVPVEIVAVVFNNEQETDRALEQIEQAKREGLIGIREWVKIKRELDGKLRITDSSDRATGKAAVIGGVAGGIIGLIAGPVGWVTATGAILGALASRLRNAGVPDKELRELGEHMTPGTTVVVAVIEHTWVKQVQQMLAQAGGALVSQAIAAEIAEQLNTQDVPVGDAESTVIADASPTSGEQAKGTASTTQATTAQSGQSSKPSQPQQPVDPSIVDVERKNVEQSKQMFQ